MVYRFGGSDLIRWAPVQAGIDMACDVPQLARGHPQQQLNELADIRLCSVMRSRTSLRPLKQRARSQRPAAALLRVPAVGASEKPNASAIFPPPCNHRGKDLPPAVPSHPRQSSRHLHLDRHNPHPRLHWLVERIARQLRAPKPFAVEIGGGTLGQRAFPHRGRFSILSLPLTASTTEK